MEKIESISLTDARAKLGELVNQVRYRGDGIMLTKNGEDVAAIVPVGVLEKWQADNQKFLDAFHAIQQAMVDEFGVLTEEEAEEVAAQLIRESREARTREEHTVNEVNLVAAD